MDAKEDEFGDWNQIQGPSNLQAEIVSEDRQEFGDFINHNGENQIINTNLHIKEVGLHGFGFEDKDEDEKSKDMQYQRNFQVFGNQLSESTLSERQNFNQNPSISIIQKNDQSNETQIHKNEQIGVERVENKNMNEGHEKDEKKEIKTQVILEFKIDPEKIVIDSSKEFQLEKNEDEDIWNMNEGVDVSQKKNNVQENDFGEFITVTQGNEEGDLSYGRELQMMDDDDFGEFNEGIPKEESMERSQKIDEFIRTLPDYSILL